MLMVSVCVCVWLSVCVYVCVYVGVGVLFCMIAKKKRCQICHVIKLLVVSMHAFSSTINHLWFYIYELLYIVM